MFIAWIIIIVILLITISYLLIYYISSNPELFEWKVSFTDIAIVFFTGVYSLIEVSRWMREKSHPWVHIADFRMEEIVDEFSLAAGTYTQISFDISMVNNSEKSYLIFATLYLPYDRIIKGKFIDKDHDLLDSGKAEDFKIHFKLRKKIKPKTPLFLEIWMKDSAKTGVYYLIPYIVEKDKIEQLG